RVLVLPVLLDSCRPSGRGCRVKAREATACGLALTRRTRPRQSSSERAAPPAWGIGSGVERVIDDLAGAGPAHGIGCGVISASRRPVIDFMYGRYVARAKTLDP